MQDFVQDFEPDSIIVNRVMPSPNHEERGTAIDMIILHYTGMTDGDAALRRLCSQEAKVSAHYLVLENGEVVQMVPESRRAWHAGESLWDGATDVNSCSIGIEIANAGHDFFYPDFPPRQIAAVITLCRGILLRRGIRADRVLGHSDVAASRKRDPGEKFPWRLLHQSGVGHWVGPAKLTNETSFLVLGANNDDVRKLQSDLSDYGYGLAVTGRFDVETKNTVIAFQRHFRPARFDGVADQSTLDTLEALLASRPAKPEPPQPAP